MDGLGRRIPFDVVDEGVNLIDTDAEPWSIQLEVRLEAGSRSGGFGPRSARR
jgi:hypothetical protein